MVSSGPSTIGRVTLPMALNGPSIPHSRYYRWPQMGPVLPVKYLSDYLQWAQYNWTDDLEWAQYNCQQTLPMASNGPSKDINDSLE
jgi:hypothetical protein